MRNPVVAAVVALAVAGCAAAPGPRTAAPAAQTTAPHPILAQAAPVDVGDSKPAKADEASVDQQPQSDHHTRQMNRVWGWSALSVGAEGAILAVITSFMMLHQNSVRSASCVDKVCSPDGIVANGKLGDLEGWNAAGWGIGAVGLAVGAYLLLTNPTDKSLGTQVGVGSTGSGSGLLLRGSF
ncbi:MAG TPA: hypothetical protein VGL81_18995 [Polyangiaceae bacterium]|jgi:hypothetical protein